MKRILLPAGGAILATGLLAAGLAGTAQADPDVDAAALAASEQKAAEILDFWTKSDSQAMRKATAYYWDNKDVKKIVQKGGYVADGKPGLKEPIGAEKKVTVKSQNVNLPKSIGKVFFEGRDGNLYWCSGTSIQSQYRNLVATAGHCVYDIAGNDEMVSRWVFVPGYYQGKAPWGIYVGKQAFTHYDFSNYEDFDRDYAFVTVYNGVGGVLNNTTKVTRDEYAAHKGAKYTKQAEVQKPEYDKAILDPKTFPDYKSVDATPEKIVGPDYPGAVVAQQEVSKATYTGAGTGRGQGYKYGEPTTVTVDKATWTSYDGPGDKGTGPDAAGNYFITHYYTQKWFVPGTDTKYFRTDYFVVEHVIKDAGRLGDNVGGQGFAWNQPTGKYVRTFGYPYAKHPDGSKPYSGVTPKWCYGKTGAKATKVPSLKIEEHISLKCAVTGGYNGAPWLVKYSNAKRMGYVNGVTSVLYDTDGNDRWDYMSSPYFDGETNSVYAAAAAVWSGSIIPKAD
ncbi:hypothetical protein OIE66_03405 [Nonomuraea sp. NBC_01738]|uniref:hypothetical protein n=1 Tax=Nonomuraea sp. NBC_01738 TaxID=2976003 RepID=UPI002E147133|nr:hypothetical protein OIE66_03405 [Nonomuraea sp. NBC_01738]